MNLENKIKSISRSLLKVTRNSRTTPTLHFRTIGVSLFFLLAMINFNIYAQKIEIEDTSACLKIKNGYLVIIDNAQKGKYVSYSKDYLFFDEEPRIDSSILNVRNVILMKKAHPINFFYGLKKMRLTGQYFSSNDESCFDINAFYKKGKIQDFNVTIFKVTICYTIKESKLLNCSLINKTAHSYSMLSSLSHTELNIISEIFYPEIILGWK